MPKTYVSNNYMFYRCPIQGIRRTFQCKRDFDSYVKRHCKSCGCDFIPGNENHSRDTNRIELTLMGDDTEVKMTQKSTEV